MYTKQPHVRSRSANQLLKAVVFSMLTSVLIVPGLAVSQAGAGPDSRASALVNIFHSFCLQGLPTLERIRHQAEQRGLQAVPVHGREKAGWLVHDRTGDLQVAALVGQSGTGAFGCEVLTHSDIDLYDDLKALLSQDPQLLAAPRLNDSKTLTTWSITLEGHEMDVWLGRGKNARMVAGAYTSFRQPTFQTPLNRQKGNEGALPMSYPTRS